MSSISEINEVSRDVISEFSEPDQARYVTASGRTSYISVVRFDPFTRDEMAGMGSTNEDTSIWVTVEDLPDPQARDSVWIGTDHFEVRMIEPHALRGYNRLFLVKL